MPGVLFDESNPVDDCVPAKSGIYKSGEQKGMKKEGVVGQVGNNATSPLFFDGRWGNGHSRTEVVPPNQAALRGLPAFFSPTKFLSEVGQIPWKKTESSVGARRVLDLNQEKKNEPPKGTLELAA